MTREAARLRNLHKLNAAIRNIEAGKDDHKFADAAAKAAMLAAFQAYASTLLREVLTPAAGSVAE